MTQHQLERAVASTTGESPRTIRARGFGPLPRHPRDLEPEDLVLAVDCPVCGRPTVLLAGRGKWPVVGECDPCDSFFEYRPRDVYVAPAAEMAKVDPAAA